MSPFFFCAASASRRLPVAVGIRQSRRAESARFMPQPTPSGNTNLRHNFTKGMKHETADIKDVEVLGGRRV